VPPDAPDDARGERIGGGSGAVCCRGDTPTAPRGDRIGGGIAAGGNAAIAGTGEAPATFRRAILTNGTAGTVCDGSGLTGGGRDRTGERGGIASENAMLAVLDDSAAGSALATLGGSARGREGCADPGRVSSAAADTNGATCE
jgi:hypothetical protein